eukprot:TRINITY_DN4866_c0_g2_i1.p1 TRINITY_DN4866_c0_g2~~TRINITY_DN4866_c0_g2_i1.p1  ORF type:complete len:214 (-),score=34.63 TRINITY_DN4866_c0_g2_i1:255-896(-)
MLPRVNCKGLSSVAVKQRRPNLSINTQQCTLHRQPVQRLGPVEPSDSYHSEDFATEIIPNFLYLGNAWDATNFDLLQKKGIAYIVNTARECDSPDAAQHGIKYLKFDLDDHSDAPISRCFQDAFRFIDEAQREKKGVLVHCHRGISRSATIVIAYLMARNCMSFEESFEFVKRKRDIINPNLGFVLALESFNSALRPPTPVEGSSLGRVSVEA